MCVSCLNVFVVHFVCGAPKLLNNDSKICFNVTTLYGTMLILVHACQCNVHVDTYIFSISMCRVCLLVEQDSKQM